MTEPEPRAGQEAARLLAAAQDWLRTSAPHLAPVDGAGETCPCLLCRAVAGLREADPDALGRWVDSAVGALGSLLAQAGDVGADAAARADSAAGAEPDDDGLDPVGTDLDGTDPVDLAEDDSEEAVGGQDGPPPRRVRRIRLDPGVED